jgi:targeting protein for Xklp2
VPNIEPKPATQAEDVPLVTERRALQRKEFDEHMKTVMQQMDDAKKKAAAEAEAREEEERRKVREAAEFHANPIKHFKPIVVKKSEKKLTEPKTPSVMKRSKGANLRM